MENKKHQKHVPEKEQNKSPSRYQKHCLFLSHLQIKEIHPKITNITKITEITEIKVRIKWWSIHFITNHKNIKQKDQTTQNLEIPEII